MKAVPLPDNLAEIWAIKDALSARHGHSHKATCRGHYAEQDPEGFVDLGGAWGPKAAAKPKQKPEPKATTRPSAAFPVPLLVPGPPRRAGSFEAP